MHSFTNNFSIVVNRDKSEVLLNFSQNIPIIPDGPTETDSFEELTVVSNPVSDLVMTGQCARKFAKQLCELLEIE